MRADNWKDFQVASVLLRIQNILDIHLIHCYQGKHNPIQRWFVDQIHVALDQLLLQKYQASNTERLVFQVLFQIMLNLKLMLSNFIATLRRKLKFFSKQLRLKWKMKLLIKTKTCIWRLTVHWCMEQINGMVSIQWQHSIEIS